ncbi:MAG: OmpA family protein [Bacteroidota bacterium]
MLRLHAALFLLLVFFLTSCTYTMKIEDGAMAYDRKQYNVAVEMLKKEYRKSDSRIEKGKIAYLLGKSYEALNQGADATSWFKTAYDNQYGVDALRDYAYALKQSEEYTEAAFMFKELGLEIGSPYEYRKDIQACEVAKGWQDEERRAYEVQAHPANTSASEYAPVLYGENELILTSDRAAATGDDTYNWTGDEFSDLFVLNLDDNSLSPLPGAVNTEDNEGTVALTPDGQTLYFTRCGAPKGVDAYCQLYESKKLGDRWGEPTLLLFQTEGVNYMHPAVSADGRMLYFTSDHPEGWGGFDLYRLPLKGAALAKPELLSRSINTPRDEQFPTFDGDTLYFASTGHTGMGGLDIFKTYPFSEDTWASPMNLKPPVNSGSDDFGLVVDRRQASQEKDVLYKGYFTSRRGEAGGDDLYEFSRVQLPPEPKPDPNENIVYRNVLDVYVVEKIYDEPGNPNSKVLGRRPLPGATIRVELGRNERTLEVDEDGKISLELKENALYRFYASKDGYLNNDDRFNSRGLTQDPAEPEKTYELEIVLDEIFVNQEIVLENIYYDFDESYIRDDAKPTLNELADILRRNPDISIQLGSHTDCIGNNNYNQNLSRDRAQAAVDYLINDAEIAADRLSAVGYGEEQPAVDCLCSRCTDEQRQANRRTTFQIVE